jgi:hypothetical protein
MASLMLLQDDFTDNVADGTPWNNALTVGTVSETGGVFQATILNSGQDYVRKALNKPYLNYWMEFKMRLLSSGFSWGNCSTITLPALYNDADATPQFYIYMVNNVVNGPIWQTSRNDDNTLNYNYSGVNPTIDTWYTYRAYYKFATAAGANDGIRRLWIDDMVTPVIDVYNLDNDLNTNDTLSVMFGNAYTDGTTMAGAFEFQSFKLWTDVTRTRWPLPSNLGYTPT